MNALVWLAIPLIPLLLAVLIGLRPHRTRFNRWVPWAALPGLAGAAFGGDVEPAALDGLMLNTLLGLDPLGQAFLALTSGLWLAAGLFALSDRQDDPLRHRFYVFWLLALSGNLGLILAQDALSFYLFFSLMSLAAYGLVVHSNTGEAWRAGHIYLILAVVGEILLFAGFVMAIHQTGGDTRLTAIAEARPEGWGLALLVLGFGIKAGMLPLHFWLPLAHPAAPVAASAVLSGAMIKAGVLGWLRVLPLDETGHVLLGETLVLLGLAAAFLAALAGVLQSRPKTILAYSSISQMGLITAGVGLALVLPDLRPWLLMAVTLYAVHHGFAKGALFLAAGMTAQRPAGGAGRLAFFLFAALPALALAGMPMTSGALAKNTLKDPLYGADLAGWMAYTEFALTLAAAGTTLLMLRFLWCWHQAQQDIQAPPRADSRRWWAWGGLAGMSLVFPLLGIAVAPPEQVPAWVVLTGLSLVWPIGLGLVLGLLAWRWLPDRNRPWLQEGDLVVPLEWLAHASQRLWHSRPALIGIGRHPARLRWVRYRLRERLELAERVLTRWETIGLLFAAAMLGLYLTLWAG
ncbi:MULTISPECIES: complex I subunit 5 family protein [unclassified Thioalkalivibrio]|uniref:complex I subunit 5 family protein n=1 Tax=unclassified Thioalkalivibrio TaxID=2621013 RepID=UPI00036FC5C9|nr:MULTISPECIES: complex I subunit 5 family protein [unclassified Thioalkalivibrio]